MIKINDDATDFRITMTNGTEFHLYSVLSNSSVLINFIRGTWCEECTNHLKTIGQWKEKLAKSRKEVTTIIITVEDEEKVKAWQRENKQPFLIAADEEGNIAKQFGFMVPKDAYSKPGMMLIDKSKKVLLLSDNLEKSRDLASEMLDI